MRNISTDEMRNFSIKRMAGCLVWINFYANYQDNFGSTDETGRHG